MAINSGLSPRVRLTGVLASVIAVLALGVTVLADNNNLGFGQTVTRREQALLFVVALLLLAAQIIAYLIQCASRPGKRRTEPTTTAASGNEK
jgi:hypothetical protein